MSSITAQQTKLDLELVPKENRLDIGKCNGRIPRGFSPREPTFQVTLDAIALTPCYPAFLITICAEQSQKEILQICPRVQGRDFDLLPSEEDNVSFLRDLGHTGVINSLNDVVVDQMHQPWRTFAALINRSLSGKTTGLDKLRLSRAQIIWGMYFQKNIDYVELLWEDFTYQIDNKEFKNQEKMYCPRFTKVIIHHFLIQEKLISWRNRIGMHTSKDDYLINTLRFVSRKEVSEKYGVVLPECLTSIAMKESKAYKTYLGFAIGVVPPKAVRKFKKASPSKKDNVPIPEDEEPVKKGKRLKTAAKKYAYKPVTSIVIREPAMETKSKRKEKEKVDVVHGNGIELLSDVALSEEAQIKEVRKKRTGDKPGVPDVTEDDSTESESESWGNDEDDSNNKQEAKQDEESDDDNQEEEEVDQENESKDDEIESDEDKGMDDTTDQFDDDVDARLEEPTQTGKEIVQGKGADKKTKVPVTSSSRSSDLASKFPNFLDIPQTDAEIVSPLDVHVHHEVLRTQAPTLLTTPVSTQCWEKPRRVPCTSLRVSHSKNQRASTGSSTSDSAKESVLTSATCDRKLIKESRNEVTLAKVSSQPQSTYEAASTLTEFELKKILLDKMEKSESYLTAPEHRDCYDGLKKSYALDKDFFFSYDVFIEA
ncbi:hypothetical protein Tco_0469351 [Tanacetum coccineum]